MENILDLNNPTKGLFKIIGKMDDKELEKFRLGLIKELKQMRKEFESLGEQLVYHIQTHNFSRAGTAQRYVIKSKQLASMEKAIEYVVNSQYRRDEARRGYRS